MNQELSYYNTSGSNGGSDRKDTNKSNRSSGVFTVLRWLTRGGSASELFFKEGNNTDKRRSRYASTSSSSTSWCSGNDIDESFIGIDSSDRSSVDTEASFSYFPSKPQQKIEDRQIEEEDRAKSLPNTGRREDKAEELQNPRRTSSGEQLGKRVHVRGKRKAPEPPKKTEGQKEASKSTGSTMRRKKRMAPRPPSTALELMVRAQQQSNPQQPDLVLCNDTLRLERGYLMHVNVQNQEKIAEVKKVVEQAVQKPQNQNQQQQMAPRPWYKRSVMQAAINVGRSAEKHDQQPTREKRRSCNVSYLANISELDRQTAEILGRDTLRAKFLKKSISSPPQSAPAFMVPKEKDDGTWKNSTRRHRSARELIAKFNAITRSKDPKEGRIFNRQRSDSSGSTAESQSAPPSPVIIMERSAPSSPIVERAPKLEQPSSSNQNKRNAWSCPRCRLHNEYWRIICRVCSAIKPYFDDFTREERSNGLEDPPVVTHAPMVTQNEFSYFGKQIFENLSSPKNSKNGYEEIREKPESAKEVQKTDFGMEISWDLNGKSKNQIKPVESTSGSSTPKQPDQSPRFQFFNQENGSPKSQNCSNGSKVEKMILGDVINVEKPPPEEKKDPPNMKIMEKISLGEVLKSISKDYEEVGTENLETNQNALNGKDEEFARRQEREKLKKMLIEMKNSLSKRSVNKIRKNNGNRVSIVPEEYTVQEPEEVEETNAEEQPQQKKNEDPVIYMVTTESTYENIKVKKQNEEQGRPIKVSSSCQTTSAGNVNPKAMDTKEAEAIIKAIITRNQKEKTAEVPKNLPKETKIEIKEEIPKKIVPVVPIQTNTEIPVVSKVETSLNFLPGEHDYANAAAEVVAVGLGDTQTSDALMRRLESAIAGGRTLEAADLARRLASLRLPCAVITKHQQPEKPNLDKKITVLVHVESRTGEAGAPLRLQLTPKWTLEQLRKKVEKDYGVPTDAQRWILGDRLATDDSATMESFGVVADGTTIFLYLIQGQQINNNTHKIENPDLPGPSGINFKPSKTESSPPKPVPTAAPVAETSSKLPEVVKMIPKSANSTRLGATAPINVPEIVIKPKNVPNGEIEEQKLWMTTSVASAPLLNLPEASPKVKVVPIMKIEEQKPLTTPPAASAPLLNLAEAASRSKVLPNVRIEEQKPLVANTIAATAPTFVPEAAPRTFVPPNVKVEEQEESWYCGTCTLINRRENLLCEACGNFRPKGAAPIRRRGPKPAEKEKAKATYEQLVRLDGDLDLVPTSASFECLVCLMKCSAKEGCVLRECLHQFCKGCLGEHVRQCDTALVPCPYRDLEYTCRENLLDREVRALVSADDYERHLRRSLAAAEALLGKDARTYHCRTADCAGFCTYDDDVNTWLCGACGRLNCLTCRAQHAGEDCAAYQARVRLEAESGGANDEEARRTRDWLEKALSTGEAIECPTCRTVLMKKWGCDWLRCSVCKTEICWVTRGPRWGPAGKGDTSAGCRCGVNGKKCHPNCNYCH